LKRKTFRHKKRLGQHFLYDPAIARRIIEAMALVPGSMVVELGAGKGILTKPLSQLGVRLIAIEFDKDLFDELETYFETHRGEPGDPSTRPELLHADFTKTSIAELLASRGLERCVLVGNIPYNLTRDVLFSFLVDEYAMIETAYIMVQREVGDRIVSPPGSRVYGITSVILQSLFSVRAVLKVSPGSFFPRPRVSSTVLEFLPLEEPLVPPERFKHFAEMVRNLFQQRRKTIQNTMKAFYNLTNAGLDDVRAATGIVLERRPEELSKEDFFELSKALAEASTTK
jgi:16S rRNA (adenine1518-N6/adenine1519-N6)-dimethyltransferase